MVDPATGAISAPVLAAGFRNNNGLQIGLNIQAWSADLDSFATLATWTGNNLSFANTDLDLGLGDFSTDGNISANVVGADEVVDGESNQECEDYEQRDHCEPPAGSLAQ